MLSDQTKLLTFYQFLLHRDADEKRLLNKSSLL